MRLLAWCNKKDSQSIETAIYCKDTFFAEKIDMPYTKDKDDNSEKPVYACSVTIKGKDDKDFKFHNVHYTRRNTKRRMVKNITS